MEEMMDSLSEWLRFIAYIVIFYWGKYLADTLHDIREQLHILNKRS
jgi:hypothetical protein